MKHLKYLVILSVYFFVPGILSDINGAVALSIPGNDTLTLFNFHKNMNIKHLSVNKEGLKSIDPESISEVLTLGVELPPRLIRIAAVGDIMPGTNYPDESYLPYNCDALFEPALEILRGSDVTIGNLEGVFSSSGGTPKNCSNPKTCYVFRMPDEYVECIKNAGFDLLGVANNHVNDFGYAGRTNTTRVLDIAGIPFAGFPDRPYTIYHTKGIKIGFCAFAPHTGTVNFKDYEAAAELVSQLKSSSDIVIVGFHAGAEGKEHQHITREDEVFLGHNRGNPWLFARYVIDAGADLVIGHGPHVVRAIEFYKGKLIAYSLGNFCTYARFNLNGPNANAPVLDISLDVNGNFVKGRIHSFLQLGEGGPRFDYSFQAMKKIRDLTRMDFPEKAIIFKDDGSFLQPDD